MKSIIVLSTLLLASNIFWIYHIIDTGVTISYRDQQIYELEETQKQLMVTFPAVAKKLTKKEVIVIASQFTDQTGYEKEGSTHIDWLRLRFDKDNVLVAVCPIWSPYSKLCDNNR